jgi:hypothetical protein
MQTIYVPAYFAPADAQVHAVLAARLNHIANAEVWRGGELFGFICEGAFRLA